MKKRLMHAVAAVVIGLPAVAVHAANPVVQVFKSAGCGCCEEWITHMQKNGFTVKAENVSDTSVHRKRLGMPEELASCHTASVEGYALEGHVPAAEVKRLLRDKPRAVGLAVPSMPLGSPGMEGPRKDPYDVFLVKQGGRRSVYQHYQ